MKHARAAVILAAAGSLASAAQLSTVGPASTGAGFDQIPAGIASEHEQGMRLIARAMLPLMPVEHRQRIIAAGALGTEGYDAVTDRAGELLVSADERYERVRHAVSPALFARMDGEHLNAMLRSVERAANDDTPIAMCFAPGTDPELVAAFQILMQEEFWGDGDGNDPRFQINNRWSVTATDGFFTGSQGDPVTLTYSFAPDGALADNLSGQNRSNQLFAWLDSRYSTTQIWQDLFHAVFDNWEVNTGVTYIHEPNDDGVEANTSGGQLGVRGDVRIFAVTLDGGSGVLAYNAFPNAGDMVFDAFDSFFNVTTSGSRRLRNVASHEHGHGLGFAHVCPQNGTKLMEPFANTNFDMVQLDDIQAGQRNYGDYNEPNDTSGEATAIGTYSIGTSDQFDLVSLSNNSDLDFYSFSTTQPLEIVVTATPAGGEYLNGAQLFNGACSAGTLTDYDDNQDLSIAIRASNGTTELVEVDDTPAGSAEELRFTLDTPGDYYVVIDNAGSSNGIQMYNMEVSGDQIPFDGPTIVAQDPIPSVLLPNTPLSIDFEVQANADTITDGPDLFYRFDGGAFTQVAMPNVGGDIFNATIPAASCDDSPEFYISVTGSFVGEVNLPLPGAIDPFGYSVGEFIPSFEDDFETVTGWNDSLSTASGGEWDRGVPVASPGAPPSDYDGSGQCYVTGNTPGEDVDFGSVFLRSPALDLDNGGTFNYAYWLSAGGGSLIGDSLDVEISTNGQITWTTLRSYTNATDAWVTDSIEIDAATGVPSTYFRFVATDVGTDNIMEAAIDAVSVGELTCDDSGGGCNLADVAEPFGVLDLADIGAFVTAFTTQDPLADIAEPFGVFDLGDLGLFVAEFTGGCP